MLCHCYSNFGNFAVLAALAAEWFSIAVLSTAMEKITPLCALCFSSEAPRGRDKRAVYLF
jgi:hypothetical protein